MKFRFSIDYDLTPWEEAEHAPAPQVNEVGIQTKFPCTSSGVHQIEAENDEDRQADNLESQACFHNVDSRMLFGTAWGATCGQGTSSSLEDQADKVAPDERDSVNLRRESRDISPINNDQPRNA